MAVAVDAPRGRSRRPRPLHQAPSAPTLAALAPGRLGGPLAPRVRARAARPLYQGLAVQILAAMVLGSLVGYLWPQSADALRPLGDLFIRLVRMTLAPTIFCNAVHG